MLQNVGGATGNEDFDECIFHVENILKEAGYQEESENSNAKLSYRLERYPLPTLAWEPVDAKLYLPGEDKPLLDFSSNRNMICINSFSTPAEGVRSRSRLFGIL